MKTSRDSILIIKLLFCPVLILKYDAAVSLKINPLIKEVLRNLTALCGKLLLERIHICGTCYMNCKSTAVDDRHIVVCKVSKRNNCSNLLVTDDTATCSRRTTTSKLSGY